MLDKSGRIVNLEKELGSGLLEVENPSRYVGPEYYIGKKEYKEGMVKCAMCFPDLYEIGMSNNAMRIIYNILNNIDDVFCDRVFAVAPDFEALLRQKNMPLFTMQEHFALNKLDYIGFSLGYELAVTDILQVLELGGIAIDVKDRKETDPITIIGGPADTNPLPFSRFVDFVHIGEAEVDSSIITDILKKYKTRSERIEALKQVPWFWYPGKPRTTRAVDETFGTSMEDPVLKHTVIPSFQVAQDHGTVEIMRGCPNGCRFCHAGQYYKPFRQRSLQTVYDLVAQNIDQLGYREVTLSSLSSGDYPDLDLLIKALNNSFKNRGISFSLPSLKVSSFSLNILEQLSEVRKSGLTFAIETPQILNQRSLNKEVPVESIISILLEAKRRGYRLAKFYFMTGLPFVDTAEEEKNIVDFLTQIYQATKINMNINIGTFIPKAHTPFQWAEQMSMEESGEHLKSIKRALMKAIPGIKVSYHEPSISYLEGLISRGDEKVCDVIQKAYESGCRLDAWDEYMKFDLWQQAIAETGYVGRTSYDVEEKLPWDSVTMNVSKKYLQNEYERASKSELTSICNDYCEHNCGVCGKNANHVTRANNQQFNLPESTYIPVTEKYEQAVITYSKTGRAVYNSHIAVLRQFEMAFQRSKVNVKFTEGFNPKPKMEFLNPITMGVKGDNELLLVELPVSEICEETVNKLNASIAEGFYIKSIQHIPMPESGAKISLSSHMTGSLYELSDFTDPAVKQCIEDKIGTESNDYLLTKQGDKYLVRINGEKNIFKLLFGSDMNKFHVAGSCNMVRKEIYLKDFFA